MSATQPVDPRETSGDVKGLAERWGAVDYDVKEQELAATRTAVEESGDVSAVAAKWDHVSYDVKEEEIHRTEVFEEERKADFSSVLGRWGEQATTVPMPQGGIYLDDEGNPISKDGEDDEDRPDDPIDVVEEGAHGNVDDLVEESDEMDDDGQEDTDRDEEDEDEEYRALDDDDDEDDDEVLEEDDDEELMDDDEMDSDDFLEDEDEDDDMEMANDDFDDHVDDDDDDDGEDDDQYDEDDDDDDELIQYEEHAVQDEAIARGGDVITSRQFASRGESSAYDEPTHSPQNRLQLEEETDDDPGTPLAPPPAAVLPIGTQSQPPTQGEVYTTAALKPATKVEKPPEEKMVPEYANVALKPVERSVDPNSVKEPAYAGVALVGAGATAAAAGAVDRPSRTASSGGSKLSGRGSWLKKSRSSSRGASGARGMASGSGTPEAPQRTKSKGISGLLALFGSRRSSRTVSGSTATGSGTATRRTGSTATGPDISTGTALAGASAPLAAEALDQRAVSKASEATALQSTTTTEGPEATEPIPSAESGRSLDIDGAIVVEEEEIGPTEEDLAVMRTMSKPQEPEEAEPEEPAERLRTGEARVVGAADIPPSMPYRKVPSMAINIPSTSAPTKSSKGPDGLSVFLLSKTARVTLKTAAKKFFSVTVRGHKGDILDASWCPETAKDGQLAALATTDNAGTAMVHFLWLAKYDEETTDLIHLKSSSISFPSSEQGSCYTKVKATGSPDCGKVVLVPDTGLKLRIFSFAAEEKFDPDLTQPVLESVPDPSPAPALAAPTAMKTAAAGSASARTNLPVDEMPPPLDSVAAETADLETNAPQPVSDGGLVPQVAASTPSASIPLSESSAASAGVIAATHIPMQQEASRSGTVPIEDAEPAVVPATSMGQSGALQSEQDASQDISTGVSTPIVAGVVPSDLPSGTTTPGIPPPVPKIMETEPASIGDMETNIPAEGHDVLRGSGHLGDREVGGFETVHTSSSQRMSGPLSGIPVAAAGESGTGTVGAAAPAAGVAMSSGSATPGTPAPAPSLPSMSGGTTPGFSAVSSSVRGGDTPASSSGMSTPSMAPEAPVLPSFPTSGQISGTDTPISGVYSGTSTPGSEIPLVPALPSMDSSLPVSGGDTPVTGSSTPGLPEAAPDFPTMSGADTPLSDGGSGTITPGLVPATPPRLPSLPGSGDLGPYIAESDLGTPSLGHAPSLPSVEATPTSTSMPGTGTETPVTPLPPPSMPSMGASGEATPGSITSGSSYGNLPSHGAPPSLPSGPASEAVTEVSTPTRPAYSDRDTGDDFKLPAPERVESSNSGVASTVDTPLLRTPPAAMTPPKLAFESTQRYDSAESVTLPSPPKLPSFSDISKIPPPPAPDLPDFDE